MAATGHSGTHTAQSMHSSGSMARKFGPSRKASTGQTSTQSVYLQRMQASVTTKVMAGLLWGSAILAVVAGLGQPRRKDEEIDGERGTPGERRAHQGQRQPLRRHQRQQHAQRGGPPPPRRRPPPPPPPQPKEHPP